MRDFYLIKEKNWVIYFEKRKMLINQKKAHGEKLNVITNAALFNLVAKKSAYEKSAKSC